MMSDEASSMPRSLRRSQAGGRLVDDAAAHAGGRQLAPRAILMRVAPATSSVDALSTTMTSNPLSRQAADREGAQDHRRSPRRRCASV